jgi:hypothetical protein
MKRLAIVASVLFFLISTQAAQASETQRLAIARLLVSVPDTAEVMCYANEPSGDLSSDTVQALMYFFAGDLLVVPEGKSIILLSYPTNTKEQYFGPCTLIVTKAGISQFISSGVSPEIEMLPTRLEPVRTSMRIDIKGRPVTGRAPSLTPEPLFPEDTNIIPGAIELEWNYIGSESPLRIELLDADGQLMIEDQVPGNAKTYRVNIDPDYGDEFYWRISDNEVTRHTPAQFMVVTEDNLSHVQLVCNELGYPVENPREAVDAIDDVVDLSLIYSVFQYYNLGKEMELALLRMTDLVNSGKGIPQVP